MGKGWLEISPVEQDLLLLVNGRLIVSQQCLGSQEGKLHPGGIIQHQIVKIGDDSVVFSINATSLSELSAVLGSTI